MRTKASTSVRLELTKRSQASAVNSVCAAFEKRNNMPVKSDNGSAQYQSRVLSGGLLDKNKVL